MTHLAVEMLVAASIASPQTMTISITSGISKWDVSPHMQAEFREVTVQNTNNDVCVRVRRDRPPQTGILHFGPPSRWPFDDSQCIDDMRATPFALATEGPHPILDAATCIPNHLVRALFPRPDAVCAYPDFPTGSHPMHACRIYTRWGLEIRPAPHAYTDQKVRQ
jgi:hypothetical protein